MSMARFEVRVSFKPGVLDAEGNAALDALRSLGFNASSVSTAKVYRIETSEPQARVEEMCRKLLANPIIQDYRVSKR
ncbi:MAG: phosphoribosylformylglycinamidine synthase subunit PurS [Candidatus Norongarragalinales archaeon]